MVTSWLIPGGAQEAGIQHWSPRGPVPASYEIDKHRRLVITTASGVLTLAEGLSHQEKLSEDKDFDPAFSQLMDLSGVTEIAIDSAGVRALAIRSVFSIRARRAFLINSELLFAFSRMFATFRAFEGEHQIEIFRNREEAMDWLSKCPRPSK
jgi:hypothetical protein